MYITTPEFNKLRMENFEATLKEAKGAAKNDISDFIKKKQILINLKISTKNCFK